MCEKTDGNNTYSQLHEADPDAAAAARDLARLMERQLGYVEGHIDPIALRLFIQAYWSRVSYFAHKIHEGQ